MLGKTLSQERGVCQAEEAISSAILLSFHLRPVPAVFTLSEPNSCLSSPTQGNRRP